MKKSRFSVCDLRTVVNKANTLLKSKSSEYSFKVNERNGYLAVDVYKESTCQYCLDCAEPPKILASKVEEEVSYLLTQF